MPRVSHFPQNTLQECLVIAETIWTKNSGKDMRRITLLQQLGKSPESSTSRTLITSSSSYGLTQGGYSAEVISLTERGRIVVETGDLKTRIDAILGVELFSAFFEHYKNAVFPADPAAYDFLKARGLPESSVKRCLEVIKQNGADLGLIQEISGKQRIVSIEHVLDETNSSTEILAKPNGMTTPPSTKTQPLSPLSSTPSYDDFPNAVPALHIDIQIHISAEAKPEQIEQIFASMAKHLYRRT